MKLPSIILRQFWFGSIRRQVMLSFAVTSALVMLAFGYGIVRHERDFLREQSLDFAQSLAHAVAVSSTSWVLADDVVGLQEVLASVGRSPQVKYALVLSSEGRVLAASEAGRVGQYVSDDLSRKLIASDSKQPLVLFDGERLLDVAEPVLAGERQVGWVRIGLGRELMDRNLRRVELVGFVMMAVAVSITLLVAMLLSGRLTSRLQRLVEMANQIHAGQRKVRVQVPGIDEISRLADNLNRMLDELERSEHDLDARGSALARANADLTRFAEVSAHHLMEPTRRLSVYSQQLRARMDGIAELRRDEAARTSLDYIEHDAAHLRNLVRDVQLYLASGTPRGKIEQLDTNAVLAALVQRLGERLQRCGAAIEREPLPPVMLDKPRLNDIFSVLLDNALLHAQPLDTEKALCIRVSGERGEGLSRFRISDNGPGIPAEYRERVFEIFERLTSGAGGGSGIGLAIARNIVESRHGCIWIEQSEQGGVAVVFELPD
ncbi:MAG: ATP-binding protein [Gallionella sp.]|nr:ATP-binding protein [Gallionella sp.]